MRARFGALFVALAGAGAVLAGQPAPVTTIAWEDDPTYAVSGIAWEVETATDGIVPCVGGDLVGAERQCAATFSRAVAQTIRLRGVGATVTSDWSEQASAPAVAPGSPPGAFTITFAGPLPPLPMATRLYLPSTGTPSVSPAFGSGWEVTTNADRRTAVTARISSAMTTKDGVGDATNTDQLLRQYIYGPLAAQTLDGTVKGVMRMASNTANIGMGASAFRIAKCNGDGSTVTEIIAVTSSPEAASAAPPATEGTTLENRRLEGSPANTFAITVPSTTIDEGDFLIVELGYKDNTTDTGRFVSISFGDDSATDLPEDETTTTADNPWVEFSDNITLSAGGRTALLTRPFPLGMKAGMAWRTMPQ